MSLDEFCKFIFFMKKSFVCFLVLLFFFLQKNPSFAFENFASCPAHLSVRHIEAKGIGYKKGYSSLDFFYAKKEFYRRLYLPFIDFRAHIFDDGRFASNIGLGLRYNSSPIYGINLYYDYRNTSEKNFNQIAFGFETLGKIFDFRINGYFPLGPKKSSVYGVDFLKFEGNSMLLSSKKKFALTGGNAEVEFHVDRFKNSSFSFALGPYYLKNEEKKICGGKARSAIDFFNFARLEGSVSYDSNFRWIGQIEIGITIPFKSNKSKNICPEFFSKKILQPVYRHEIIALDTVKEKSVALDPLTNRPIKFWFVNNTSHSLGTFENPFNNFSSVEESSAENDVVYVFSGDGTDKGMNSGFIMKDGQRLLGAARSHTFLTTLGSIKTPSFSSSPPVLSNSLNPFVEEREGAAVRVSNNCEVSGFIINDFNERSCISSFFDSIENCKVTNNTLNTSRSCIAFFPPLFTEGGAGGAILISSNRFIGVEGINFNERGIAIYPLGGEIMIVGNAFVGNNSADGFTNPILSAKYFSENQSLMTIANNYINSPANDGTDAYGMLLQNSSNGDLLFSITNNYVKMPENFPTVAGIEIDESIPSVGFPGKIKAVLRKNISIVSPSAFGYIFNNELGDPAFLEIDFGSDNIGTRKDIP